MMKVITNHHPREIVYGCELPEKEKKEFDYLEDINSESFFKYKGKYHHLGDFLTTQNIKELEEWDGYSSDSYFSGLVVKIVENGDFVIVGTYIG